MCMTDGLQVSWKMGTFNYGSEKTEDKNIWIGWFWFSVLRRSPSLASLFSVHFRHGYREKDPVSKIYILRHIESDKTEREFHVRDRNLRKDLKMVLFVINLEILSMRKVSAQS